MKPFLWITCIALLLVGNALAADNAASTTDQNQMNAPSQSQTDQSTANQGTAPEQGTKSDQGATSDQGTTPERHMNSSGKSDGSSAARDGSSQYRGQGSYRDQGYTDEATTPPSEPRANVPPPAGSERLGNLDIGRIERLIRLRGFLRNGVYTVRLPSRFTNIMVAGVPLPASMVPASIIYFKEVGPNRTMVDGDLVVLQNQVNPVIDVALDNGLHVTGLHNPFLWDRPRAELLHFSGMGSTDQLASAVGRVLDQFNRPGPRAWIGVPSGTMREGTTYEEKESGTCPVNPSSNVCGEEESEGATCEGGTCTTGSDRAYSPESRRGAYEDGGMDLSTSGINPRESNLDIGPIQDILNVRPISREGTYKFVFGRTATVQGTQIGWEMGLKSEINFAGTNNRAIATGELAIPEAGLQNALRALRNSNIDILAIVNHMTNDNPRLIFVHFMGIGRATDLARGFHDALTGQVPPRSEYRRPAAPPSEAEPPSTPEY